jgi:hypothetical protein
MKTWLLLDSQSTVDMVSKCNLVTKIHWVKTQLIIRCNAEIKTTNYKGRLSGYEWAWFYPGGIFNILSLNRAKDRYRLTLDSATDNYSWVHKDNRKIFKFQEATKRQYYFDTADCEIEQTILITTVDDNKSRLSAHCFLKVKIARALQRMIGKPMTKDVIHYVTANLTPNCPITVQGKTMRQPWPKICVKTTQYLYKSCSNTEAHYCW